MASGCQIWDASGNLVFDTSDQTVKFFGSVTVGNTGIDTQTGTITDSRFTAYAGHTPFYVEIYGGKGYNGPNGADWTFSGNNLNWSFPISGSRPKTTILYGIAGMI